MRWEEELDKYEREFYAEQRKFNRYLMASCAFWITVISLFVYYVL